MRGLVGCNVSTEYIAAHRIGVACACDAAEHAFASEHDFAAKHVDLTGCSKPRELLLRPHGPYVGQRRLRQVRALVPGNAKAQPGLVRIVSGVMSAPQTR